MWPCRSLRLRVSVGGQGTAGHGSGREGGEIAANLGLVEELDRDAD